MFKKCIILMILFLLFQQIRTQNSTDSTTQFDSTTPRAVTTDSPTSTEIRNSSQANPSPVTANSPSTSTETPSPSPAHPGIEDRCPPLTSNMDSLTQAQFTSILTDTCRYDKLIKPPTDNPLSVYVQIDLLHIESVEQLQFKAHMLIQYLYRDHRLQFETISPNRGVILGEQLLRDKIWVPHLMIRNQKDTTLMGIDGRDVFVSISPQGDVVYSYRMTATFYCWMNLQKFPFDSQDCTIRWNSWTYNTSNLILHWDDDEPVKVANNLYLTEFVLTGTYNEETAVPSSFSKGAFVGNFSELVFRFRLSRQVGYYIMDYFLPSILLVITSWVTFWLQADASPPRVTLGTSTMLAFITLNGGLTKNLPKVSYIKASEIWFLACICFIFCSMAEFAFVNVIWRRRKKVELQKKSSRHILKGALTPSLARRQLRKAESTGSLHRARSCTSLNEQDNHKPSYTQNNYLTVHSFMTIPTIQTQSVDELMQREDSVTSIPVPPPSPPSDGNKNQRQEEQQQESNWHTMTPQEVAMWIDKKSRIVFPVSFLIFNIFYWTFVYLL